MVSYLETDKYQNVRFYRKFGFEVIAQAEALEVPTWFMSRPGIGSTLPLVIECADSSDQKERIAAKNSGP